MYVLPNKVTINYIRLLCELVDQISYDQSDNIQLEAKSVEFVDPFGLCLLSFLGYSCVKKNQKISLVNIKSNIDSYLKRMNALDYYYANEEIDRRINSSASLVEVIQISDQYADTNVVAMRLASAILSSINEYEKPDFKGATEYGNLEYHLQYVFVELLENSTTHARGHGYGSSNVWVAAQYYPKKEAFYFCVIDNGCGFYNSLKSHERFKSESSSNSGIELALLPKVSCNKGVGIDSNCVNQGLGLTIIKDIITKSSGSLWLISGDKIVICKENSQMSYTLSHEWSGIILHGFIPRNNLNLLKFTEITEQYHSKNDDLDASFIF